MTTTDAAIKVAPVELETGASLVCLVRLGGENMTIRWMMPIAVLVMAAACGSPADVESELTRGEAMFLLKGILALRETGGLTLVELSGDGVVASCPLDCAMDLTLSHKPHSAATGVYRGNVCGHEGVEYEVSLGVILLSGQLPPAVLG